ncbi:MAG: protein kinase [Pirellulales bacterium]
MDDRLVDLLERFDERVRARRGNCQQIVAAQQLEPDTRRELAEAVKCLRLIDRVRRAHEPLPPAPDQPAASDAINAAPRRRIGRFEIVRELGSGGHGVVFLAWDPAARRHVALKTPHPDALFTLALRERFLLEGIAAARLTHPNIVSVLEVDRSGPLCYIVSAYSDGRSLAALLQDRGGPLSPRLAAQWAAELADAVEHAHRHGVLHRDLKPANVVLESVPTAPADKIAASGETPALVERAPALSELVPKLTDFGLAKLIDADDARTRTGVMLGTPAYLPPEQVDSALGTPGSLADVYGLGTILYECLTGRPPFASESQADLLRQIAAGDVAAPRSLHNELPRDLEAICLRALARRPIDRYASAAALAADLRRFLAGDVTRARPVNLAGRSLKWARRRPAAAAALSVAFVAAIAISVGALWHFAQMESALSVAERARARAEQGERDLRQLVYFRDMQEAHQALEAQDVLKAGAILRRQPAGAAGERPGFLLRHLQARATGMPIEVSAHKGHAHSVDFSTDGSRVVTAGADGRMCIWDAATGKNLGTMRSLTAEINVARFSPDGRTIASADSEGHMCLWDVATQQLRAELTAQTLANINCLAWTRDGRHVVAAGNPGDVALEWDVGAGNSRVIPLGHGDEVNALALSPDDLYLATGSSDGMVHVHDIAHGDLCLAHLHPRQSHVTCVAFSPDGQFLATAGVHRSVKIWNVDRWTPAATFEGQVDRIGAVAFSPREPVLAFGDRGGVIREWDWASNRIVRIVDSGHGRLMSAAYALAMPYFAASARDGSLCIWDQRPQEQAVGTLAEMHCAVAEFTRDSRYLVTSDGGPGISVFDTQNHSIRRSIEPDETLGGVLAIVPVGRSDIGMLWQRGSRATFHRGPVRGPKKSVELANHFPIGDFTVSTDGRVLFSGQRAAPDHIRFWDPDTGRPAGMTPDRNASAHQLVCSSRGDLLAIGGDGGVRVWDIKREIYSHKLTAHAGPVECVAFSPDDRLLAGGGQDGQVCLWDLHSGVQSPLVLGHAALVNCIAFCPDEPLLVTGDLAGNVRAWSLASGEELFQLAKFPTPVVTVAFSPDGQWLVASHVHLHSKELRSWHAPD